MRRQDQSIPASNRPDRGAATVELALLLVPLLLTLIGTIELGRYFWTQHVVTSAATEGARMAILNEPTDAEVRARAAKVMTDGGISASPTVNISARTANQPVTVTVSIGYTVFGLTGLAPAFAALNSITSASTMVHVP